jgi:hypothetical protein
MSGITLNPTYDVVGFQR